MVAGTVRLEAGDAMSTSSIRNWRELATDWRLWVCIAACLLIAAITTLLGYD